MTLEEYQKELKKHDWYYFYSDSNSVVFKGQDNEKRLKELAKTDESFKTAFEEEYIKHFPN